MVVEDFWFIQSLNTIRREMEYIGAVHYTDGSMDFIADCWPGSPLVSLLMS
jgi:hypothetical protein